MKHITNNRLVTSAHTYIENAIRDLEFMQEREGTINYGQMFNLKNALRNLKMSRSLLKKTTFNHKDKYGRQMKPE